MKTYAIVVGIVFHEDKLLILKRHPERKFYADKWEFVCGWNKRYETVEESVEREVNEEISCEVSELKRGHTFEIPEPNITWVILPFLVTLKSASVKIDSEHTEFKWVDISELDNYDCVPGIKEDLKAVGLL